MSGNADQIIEQLKNEISSVDGIEFDMNDPDIMSKDFVADIGFDSLDMIGFYFQIEEKFDVPVSEADIDSGKVATFGGMVEHLVAGKS